MLAYKDDDAVLTKLMEIKHKNKEALCAYLKDTQGLSISPDTIFDIQVKRLHEYKRQQLNALYIIDKYLEIKAGRIPAAPVTAIFGAKAAPAYTIAKDIIHLILCLQEIINNDPEVNNYLRVVMVENYNVTKAEKTDPCLRYLRADLAGVQGSQRHRKHEVHVKRRGDPRYRGWRQRGDS